MVCRHMRTVIVAALVVLFALPLPVLAGGDAVAQTGVPLLDSLLAWIANPTVAYILLVIGLMALAAELAAPGLGVPAIVGVVSLILALYGLGQLPTNWAGVALIVGGIVMLLLDLKFTSVALSVGALVAFGLGSLLLFSPPWETTSTEAARLSPWLIGGMTVGVGLFFLAGLRAGIRAQLAPIAVGRETLIGKIGTVQEALDPHGVVHVEGEQWTATCAEGLVLLPGTKVRVTRLDGLTVFVEPLQPSGNGTSIH